MIWVPMAVSVACAIMSWVFSLIALRHEAEARRLYGRVEALVGATTVLARHALPDDTTTPPPATTGTPTT